MRLSELREQMNGVKARYDDERARLRAQIGNYARELSGLTRRRTLQDRAVDLAQSQLDKYERLTTEGVTSQLELDNARNNDISQRIALEGIDQQIVACEGTLSEVRFTLTGMDASEERELSQLRVQISQLEDSRTGLEAQSGYIVRSPIAGTVTAL